MIEKISGFILFLLLCSPVSFAESTLLSEFIRIHSTLTTANWSSVPRRLEERAGYLETVFDHLKAPENLHLVISDSLEMAAYRPGEIILPLDAPVFLDYFLALAYFDSNMNFTSGESKSWDTYRESYRLAKELTFQRALFDEGLFLFRDNGSRDFVEIEPDEVLRLSGDATMAENRAAQAIRARNKSAELRHSDAYVGEFKAYFAILFADLFVAILHQNPEVMSTALESSGIADMVSDAPYRSFGATFATAIRRVEVNSQFKGYKYSRIFAPVRQRIWQKVADSKISQADQLKRLEGLFFRMKEVMLDSLNRLDSKIASTGTATKFGETSFELLANLGYDRYGLGQRLLHPSCGESVIALVKE